MDFEELLPLLAAGAGGLAATSGSDFFEPGRTGGNLGYQGSIPQNKAVRRTVPVDYNSGRRPGASSRKYFTDTQFVDRNQDNFLQELETATGNADLQAQQIAENNRQRYQDITGGGQVSSSTGKIETPNYNYGVGQETNTQSSQFSPENYLQQIVDAIGSLDLGGSNSGSAGGSAGGSGSGGAGVETGVGFTDEEEQNLRDEIITIPPNETVGAGVNLGGGSGVETGVGFTDEEEQNLRNEIITIPRNETVGETINLDGGIQPSNDREKQILDIYNNYFGRDPKQGGFNYWSGADRYQTGDHLKDAILRGGLANDETFIQDYNPTNNNMFAQGGPVGQYTDSTVDGLSDDIPAIINGQQPAALTGGEYVVPSDVVSGVGNGNSKAGAQRLAQFAEQVRKQRTGSSKQPKSVDFEKTIADILGGKK